MLLIGSRPRTWCPTCTASVVLPTAGMPSIAWMASRPASADSPAAGAISVSCSGRPVNAAVSAAGSRTDHPPRAAGAGTCSMTAAFQGDRDVVGLEDLFAVLDSEALKAVQLPVHLPGRVVRREVLHR